MGGLLELQERVNDTVVQTRCDRRSLATILVDFRNRGANVSSLSSFLRMIIEQMHFIVVSQGAEEILSTEDATFMIKGLGRAGLNPGMRAMFTHNQQSKKESLFLEHGNFDYIEPRTRCTKEMKDKSPGVDLRPHVVEQAKEKFLADRDRKEKEKEEESIKQAQKRREEEAQQMKTGFGQAPDGIVKAEDEE